MPKSSVTRIELATRSWTSTIVWYLLYLGIKFVRYPSTTPRKGPQVWTFPPNKNLIQGCDADRWQFEDWDNIVLKPKESMSTSRRVVLYIHGGGFVGGITTQHWKTIASLTCKLDSDTVVVPYPLAPLNDVHDVRFLRFAQYATVLLTFL